MFEVAPSLVVVLEALVVVSNTSPVDVLPDVGVWFSPPSELSGLLGEVVFPSSVLESFET